MIQTNVGSPCNEIAYSEIIQTTHRLVQSTGDKMTSTNITDQKYEVRTSTIGCHKTYFYRAKYWAEFSYICDRPLVYPDSCYLVVEVLLDRLHGRTFLNDDASRTLNDLLDDGERWDDRRSDVEPHTLLTANICQS